MKSTSRYRPSTKPCLPRFGLVKISTCLLLALLMGHPAKAQHPAPQRYSCITHELDTERWLKEGNRTFDQRGILLQAGAYHPLGIATYGIMRYEDYLATGNAVLKRAALQQYQYFCDTNLVTRVDGGQGLLLPYRYAWKDNVPPWHSGMAQGLALSYLWRYYALSQDSSALVKMQQVAFVLLKPASNGGTIGRTPEGYPWIEEYPTSKLYPNVLNGSINGLIGLHEYCTVFPEDLSAKRMRDSCYQSLILTLSAYDTPDWTLYKRVENAFLQPHYLRYQLAELSHLQEILPHPLFERQMMLWAMKGYQKVDSTIKCYRVPRYEYAWEAVDDETHRVLVDRGAFAKIMVPWKPAPHGNPATEITSLPLVLKAKTTRHIHLPDPPSYIELEFQGANMQQAITVTGYDAAGKEMALMLDWQEAKLSLRAAQAISELVVHASKKASCTLVGLRYPSPDQQQLPRFGFRLVTGRFELKQGQACMIDCLLENIPQALLFYRTETTMIRWPLATWRNEQAWPLPLQKFVAPKAGWYEFMIAFPIVQPNPRVLRLEMQVSGE